MNRYDLPTILLLISTVSAFGQFNRNQRKIEPIPTDTAYIKKYIEDQKKLKQADFPGGMAAFYKYVGKKMKMPKDARQQKIKGKVFVRFKIDSIGNIPTESIKVVGRLFDSCDKEAVRLISQSPTWIPAFNAETNKNVDSYFQLPIFFYSKD